MGALQAEKMMLISKLSTGQKTQLRWKGKLNK